jgi:hypothetical protein
VQRLSGAIERVDGNTIFGTGADGSTIIVKLADNAVIIAVSKATFADIRPGDYVGTGAIPQADGSQKAVELRFFPKPQEDGGHFYEEWYGAPNGTMTNGFVQPVVATMVSGVRVHRGQVPPRREANRCSGERACRAQCFWQQGRSEPERASPNTWPVAGFVICRAAAPEPRTESPPISIFQSPWSLNRCMITVRSSLREMRFV